MKKLLSLTLTFLMLLTLVPLSVFNVSAETLTDEQGLKYKLSRDGTYYIASGCDSDTKEIVIPHKYNNLPVREIGGWAFWECYNLTSIEIPDSVTRIGESAFRGCISLKSIEIPDSVTVIGEWSFMDCRSLTSVKTSDSLEGIGNGAFANCKSLTNIEIPDSVMGVGGVVFSSCSNLTDIYCEATVQPAEWNENWIYGCNATVHWGYKNPDDTSNDDFILGDINGNGIIDMTDYILLKRAYFGTYTFTDAQNKAGDINGNGKIDMTDYILLKRIYFGTYKIGDEIPNVNTDYIQNPTQEDFEVFYDMIKHNFSGHLMNKYLTSDISPLAFSLYYYDYFGYTPAVLPMDLESSRFIDPLGRFDFHIDPCYDYGYAYDIEALDWISQNILGKTITYPDESWAYCHQGKYYFVEEKLWVPDSSHEISNKTYESLGENKYRFTFDVYYECEMDNVVEKESYEVVAMPKHDEKHGTYWQLITIESSLLFSTTYSEYYGLDYWY